MKPSRITIEQLASNVHKQVLNYHDKLMVSDHIAQEYLFEEPCRIDALTIMVCRHGHLEYEVNLEPITVDGANILVNMPESIIQFRGSRDLDAYVLLISPDLLQNMSYDMLQQATSYLSIKKHFHATVPMEQVMPLLPFLELFKHLLSHDVPETDEIVRNLLQAFLLSILSLMRKHKAEAVEIDHTATRGSRQLFERFMDALSHHHQHERQVKFYADKLCVTPKYLSMVVKQYSGKSPSDWICEYVIAEAKSLLHYSQMPIQEAAFHLNFPSQSSFGKFFKQKTGLSPSQYIHAEKSTKKYS